MRCSVCDVSMSAEDVEAHYASAHPTAILQERSADGSVTWPPSLSLERSDLLPGRWFKITDREEGIIPFEVAPGHSMGWLADGNVLINGFKVRRPYRLWPWLLRRYTQVPGSVDKRRVRLRRRTHN